jgi:hypothetical protein
MLLWRKTMSQNFLVLAAGGFKERHEAREVAEPFLVVESLGCLSYLSIIPKPQMRLHPGGLTRAAEEVAQDGALRSAFLLPGSRRSLLR